MAAWSAAEGGEMKTNAQRAVAKEWVADILLAILILLATVLQHFN